jgi:hypothetical protein
LSVKPLGEPLSVTEDLSALMIMISVEEKCQKQRALKAKWMD